MTCWKATYSKNQNKKIEFYINGDVITNLPLLVWNWQMLNASVGHSQSLMTEINFQCKKKENYKKVKHESETIHRPFTVFLQSYTIPL